MRTQWKSLELLLLLPVLVLITVAGIGLYFLILEPVDEFVDRSIRDNLSWLSGDAHAIIDRELDALNRFGLADDEKARKIRELAVRISLEDFARQNDIGVIVHRSGDGETVFETGAIAGMEALAVAAGDRREGYLSLPGRGAFYFRTRNFVPWKWRITLAKDASAYASLVQNARYFYLGTGVGLVLIASLFVIYLQRAIARPINHIVRHLREGQAPDYRGVAEFEFLAGSIAQMMRSLQEKTSQLEATLENMSDGIAVYDADLRLVAWNRQFAALNSYPRELMQAGRTFADILRHNIERGDYGHRDPDKELAKRLRRAREEPRLRLEIHRADGTWVEMRRSPMPDGGFVVAYSDITDRKAAEAELARYRDQLEELVEDRTSDLTRVNERLEESVRETEAAKRRAEEANLAKSRFLASMSHDLRTPLNAIIGFTRLVMRRARDSLPPRQHANLEKIAMSAGHLLTLIDDILDYTRTEDVRPREIRLDTLVDECLRTVEPMVDKDRVQVTKEMTPELPSVFTDERKLKRILINLLSNAVEFTEKGSVRVRARHRNGEVDIAVEDTGIGIPEEALGRIFEEFEQVDPRNTRRPGGTGLGLSICRRFSRLIGGRIQVQSKVGVGSTFALTIPIRYGAASIPEGDGSGDEESADR